MKVSVIIPVYKDWGSLGDCLGALSDQTYPSDLIEIVVVNNDPSVPQPENFSVPANCLIAEEARPGSYSARNKGLELSNGELICFTDADCQPCERWIERIVAAFESGDMDLLGGGIRVDTRSWINSVMDQYETLYSFQQEHYVTTKNFAATANLSTRRKTFDSVGNFDASLFTGGDSEWCKRAVASGCSIAYIDEAFVYHPVRTISETLRKIRRLTGGRAKKRVHKIGYMRSCFSYVVTLPFKIFPPTDAARKMFSLNDVPVAMRFKLYGLFYLIKLTKTYELGRLFLLRASPERR